MDQPDRKALGFLTEDLDPLRYKPMQVSYEEGGVFEVVRSMIAEGSRVLDVGCGIGWMSQELRDAGKCEVVGVEPDPARAEAARGKGLDVVTGVLDDLDPAALGPFDVVLFGDVLEHLPDPTAMLVDARRFLRPQGLVVASVPNIAHWTVRLRLLAGRFDYTPSGIMDATHLRWFTEKTIKNLFEGAGYRVMKWRTTAGVEMGAYSRPPFRWLGQSGRSKLVRSLNRRVPRLFGMQHVVQAQIVA